MSTDGEVFPLAGVAGQVGHQDGAGPEATLAHPNGITVSPSGNTLYVNTLDGVYNGGEPANVTVRTVELMTLTKALDAAQAEGGAEGIEAAYRSYSEDPIRGKENTVGEMIAYGYRHLREQKFAEALKVFQLNAEAHLENAAAQYQFGEANRYLGQTDAAIAQYRKTLELDPEHANAAARLAQLGAE